MNFLGLLGLLSLPLIYLLHLLRERQRRHAVSSLELWAWLQPEVRGALPRRVPWTRILALHLFAGLGLSLALVNPWLPLPLAGLQAQRLILILDTSSSMGAVDVSPTRLASAQASAAARLAGLSGDDSVVLIAAGPAAHIVSDSAESGLPALASALARLAPAGVGHDWPGALALASAAAAGPGVRHHIVVFTDGAFELPAAFPTALPAPVEWVLVGSRQPNQAVVTLAARPAASGAPQVFARVANFSDEPAQRVLTLLGDGQVLDNTRVTLSPSGSAALAWTLPPGSRTVEVRLSSADALPADDRAALGLSGPPIRALLVSTGGAAGLARCQAGPADGERTAVERALCAVPNLDLRTMRPETYVAYEPFDLVVFQGWLPGAWPQGGVLVLDPPANSSLLPSAEPGAALPLTVPPAGTEALLADVSLANVTFGQALSFAPPDWLRPVLAWDGQPLVWRGAAGLTRLVVLAFQLDESNITRRSAFPILIANAARALLPPPLPESIRPGEGVSLPSAGIFPSLTLTYPQGRAQTYGVERPERFEDTARAGLYLLEGRTPDGEPRAYGFGVNAGALDESDLRLRAEPAFSLSPAAPPPLSPGRLPLVELWPMLVLLVAALLVIEMWYAWR